MPLNVVHLGPLSPVPRKERDSFDCKKMTLDVLPNFLQLLPRITMQRAGTPTRLLSISDITVVWKAMIMLFLIWERVTTSMCVLFG